jgi:hypothetical protein
MEEKKEKNDSQPLCYYCLGFYNIQLLTPSIRCKKQKLYDDDDDDDDDDNDDDD